MTSTRPGRPQKPGRFSDSRKVWVSLHHGEWALFAIEHDSADDNEEIDWESGPNIYFKIQQGKRYMKVSLTSLTEEELDALEDFIGRAITMARPIIQQRDQEAQAAHDNGDDSFTRLYRAVPRVIDRTRPERQHGAGVHVGSDGVPGVDGDARGEGDGDRPADLQVAERSPQDVGSQDDGATADGDAGLGSVGED